MSKELQDGFLADIVRSVTTNGGEASITLNINGAVITGFLIGAQEYFDLLGQLISTNAVTEESVSGWLEITSNTASYIREQAANATDESPLELNYIHLKDARYISGGQYFPSFDTFLWRGKLNEVDGFSFGAYSPRDND